MRNVALFLTVASLATSAWAAPKAAKGKTAKGAKAAAPDTPRLVVHPIVLERASRRGNEDVHALFQQVLAAEVDQVPDAQVDAFLETQPGKTCQNRVPCLVALAKATKASFVLYATVAPSGPKIELTAKVLKADGKVAREVKKLLGEKPAEWTREAALEDAYKQLVTKLKLLSLPGVKKSKPAEVPVEPPPVEPPPVEPPPVAKEPPPKQPDAVATKTPDIPPPPPKKTEPVVKEPPPDVVGLPPPRVVKKRDSGSGGLRLTAYALGGAGVLAGAGAGVLAALANGDSGKLTPDSLGRIPPDQVETALGMKSKATMATALGVGAGVAVAAGATLFFLSSGDDSVAVVPTQGGAVVVFSGALP